MDQLSWRLNEGQMKDWNIKRPTCFSLGTILLFWPWTGQNQKFDLVFLPQENTQKGATWEFSIARHWISGNDQATNQNELNKKNRKFCHPTKTNTRRADKWNGETGLFLARKKLASTNDFRSHKYELIFAALFIFQTKILEYSCR